MYGGLGNDFLHGGSGDDAISGAEALLLAAVGQPGETQTSTVVVLVDELILSGYERPYNPGNLLMFNNVDLDGQHIEHRTRAGEFALFDEYDPLRRIILTDGTVQYEFLLNFNQTEGTPVIACVAYDNRGRCTSRVTAYNEGRDAIFGDLGNDWLVGGPGEDDLFGGYGNDLLNVDDDLTTNSGANDKPDTHPTYEDLAYGGAGRDVLIGNTGGDRGLIDWVGEFDSYLVPFAPFGMASVSRTLQPQLPEFLYLLSASDGADPTRPYDTGTDPLRNGEPEGELGLVLQKDFDWHDQTGAPADPQAGNIPGGNRDVLRTANFNDGKSQGFYSDSGVWIVTNGRLEVVPSALGGDAVSVFYVDSYLPNYFEIQATINAAKPLAGYQSNAYLIFDYVSPTDFKFAGVNISTNKIEMGYRTADGWLVTQAPITGSNRTPITTCCWRSTARPPP